MPHAQNKSLSSTSTRSVNAFVRPRTTSTSGSGWISRSNQTSRATTIAPSSKSRSTVQSAWSRTSNSNRNSSNKKKSKSSRMSPEHNQAQVLEHDNLSTRCHNDRSDTHDSHVIKSNKSVRFAEDTIDTDSNSKQWRSQIVRRTRREREANNPGLRVARYFAGYTRRA